jgi:hypothetical protein
MAGITKSMWRFAKGWKIGGSKRGGGRDFSDPSRQPGGRRSLLYNGYRVSLLGVKRPRRGVDHTPPSSAEFECGYSYIYLSPSPQFLFLACNETALYCNKLKTVVCSNPSKTKRRLLYLMTQFVPRCKHFSTRL